jgi:eukaryotic-like serine/threonine-protein kinase
MGEATAVTSPVLSKGAVLGRYVVLGMVGRGGMGEVYAAFDPELDRKVAVKLLRRQDAGAVDAEARTRLLREAQAMAKLSHPNVVVVYDVGTFRDSVFIAMEFIDGNTVGYWTQASTRSWQDVLKIFLAAGRGIAAAHAAGMVHRDFKPDNVMITREGQVRVMDFGLARQVLERDQPAFGPATTSSRLQDLLHIGDAPVDGVDMDVTARLGPGGAPAASVAPSGSYLKQKLTQTGALVGTPAYMAPEQFAGEVTDARTDQFAFCVALYEALYGHRPFDGDTVIALMANVVSGTIRAEPAKTKVPGRVRRIILRGFEVDPARRYATMDELLAELERNPSARPRAWVAGLATGALGAAIFVAARQLAPGGSTLCNGAGRRLAGVWELDADSPRKAAIERSFRASGRTGERLFEGVRTVLDGYVDRWASMYRDACEATHVRGEQSAEVLDLRMSCLGQRLSNVKALTDILSAAAPSVVENAVGAAAALPSLERCADPDMLRSVIQPPADQKTRERVDALRTEIAKVRALGDSGECIPALAAGRATLTAAKELGYLPVQAEASYVVGRAGNYCGDSGSAIGALEDAVWAAEASRHDEIAVEASAFAGGLYADYLHETKTSRRWLSYADAILTRLPGHPLLQAYTDIAWGTLLQAEGKDAEAAQRQQAALALKEQSLGPMHPDTAISAMNVGLAFHELGRDDDAEPYAKRAVETLEQIQGLKGAQVAIALYNRGEILTSLGRYPEARESLNRAIDIWTDSKSDYFIALARFDLARVALLEKNPIEARALLEPATETIAKQNRSVAAEARFLLAQALWATPRDRVRAVLLARAARKELSAAGTRTSKLAEVDAWLAPRAAH